MIFHECEKHPDFFGDGVCPECVTAGLEALERLAPAVERLLDNLEELGRHNKQLREKLEAWQP